MKPLILSAFAGLLFGCASTDTNTVTRPSGSTITTVEDQPQTATAGEGSLMPGAYDARNLPTGQFTGRERTNDQIGQRPTLPREADARELARSEEGLADGARGAGTLGQSGIVPEHAVTSETLMETSAPIGAPAYVVVAPPGSGQEERVVEEGVGSPATAVKGAGSSTNAPAGENPPTNSVSKPE